jgi:hypothetical protein
LSPAGAFDPANPTSFGSLPVRVTRDFPPLRDLFPKWHARGDGTDDTVSGAGGPMSRFYGSAEYLLWWVPGYAIPVLATTNSNTALNGFLGEPGTTAIVGPGTLVGNPFSGVRARVGAWLNDCGTCALDTGFFYLPRHTGSAVVSSDQFPLITRPVFSPNFIPGTQTPIGETGEFVAVPGAFSGRATVLGDTQLWGLDVNVLKCLCSTCTGRTAVFAGYRYLNLRENLTITENITVIGSGGGRIALTDPIGTQVVVVDHFGTHNTFNGGQIGALYERSWGRWFLGARGSVALGDTHQILDISGFQLRERPGAAPMSFLGGLLAAGPNLGRFSSDRLSFVPELTLNLGYRITPNLRVYGGYNFLLWTNVIRPGDQIDRTVDLSFVPNAPAVAPSGQLRPHPLFTQRDLAINGIQFGAEFRW